MERLQGSGDVVAIYVGSELRGKQEVIDPALGGGVAWVNAQVNAKGGEETISFKVWDSSTGVTRDKSGTSAVITTGGAVGTSRESAHDRDERFGDTDLEPESGLEPGIVLCGGKRHDGGNGVGANIEQLVADKEPDQFV